MKALVLGMGVALVLGGITVYGPQLSNLNQEMHYEAEKRPVTASTTPEVTYPDEWLEEAEGAKLRVLERRQLEADLEALETEIAALSAEKAAKLDELELY